MNTEAFENATALVTGASSGIGEAIACNLAKRGANLILAARSEDKLSRLADELREKYRNSVHVFPADLILPDAPQRLFERIKASGLSHERRHFSRNPTGRPSRPRERKIGDD